MLYQLSYTPPDNDERAGRRVCHRRARLIAGAGSFISGRVHGQAERRPGRQSFRLRIAGAFDAFPVVHRLVQPVALVHQLDADAAAVGIDADIVRVPLIEGTGELKLVSEKEYAEAQVFFGG